jgi:hypothetical protein
MATRVDVEAGEVERSFAEVARNRSVRRFFRRDRFSTQAFKRTLLSLSLSLGRESGTGNGGRSLHLFVFVVVVLLELSFSKHLDRFTPNPDLHFFFLHLSLDRSSFPVLLVLLSVRHLGGRILLL